MGKSLKAFAKDNPGRRPGMPCWACNIKEADEINEARREGTTIPVILDWLLKEKRYGTAEATRGRLNRHFSEGRHHNKDGQ